jgi:isoquinoline 1-oxidoreductase alpha subunit
MELNVNGKTLPVDADPNTPLLWCCGATRLDRHQFGCGVAACGACTVHVDGQAARSACIPSHWRREKDNDHRGAGDGPLAPVQEAWIAEQYAMRLLPIRHGHGAAALLAAHPRPTDAQIDAAMTNICRCGTYPRVRLAIHRRPAAGKGCAVDEATQCHAQQTELQVLMREAG